MPNEQPLIELRNITKSYESPEGRVTPLKEVSAVIPPKSLIAVMGPSGTGKTTLFRLLNRLEDPDQGSITYKGKPLFEWNPISLRRQVHYVFQSPVLFPKTVADNLNYPLKLQGKSLSEEEMVRLLERVGLSKSYLTRSIEKLSGGEKQRVHLARSLSLKPQVLLLDEPTASLDPESTERIEQEMRRYREEGHTVLWITHQPEQARRVADQIWHLESGHLRQEEIDR
ncbi:MAG: phosphate ABC transporter ATP-binding protein [Thermoactinomyces sp.]